MSKTVIITKIEENVPGILPKLDIFLSLMRWRKSKKIKGISCTPVRLCINYKKNLLPKTRSTAKSSSQLGQSLSMYSWCYSLNPLATAHLGKNIEICIPKIQYIIITKSSVNSDLMNPYKSTYKSKTNLSLFCVHISIILNYFVPFPCQLTSIKV